MSPSIAYLFCNTQLLLIYFAVGKFKDARSVSLYPYTRSQILQYVKYILNKLTLLKDLQTFVTNKVFVHETVKTQEQQTKHQI